MKKFKTWSKIENQTWQKLVKRQMPNLETKASQLWLNGFQKLELSREGVPDFDATSQRLSVLSGWQLEPTAQVFADGDTWFNLLKKQRMLITNYIRPHTSLDYTPMPDVFHDAFGHLPFFADPEFCKVIQLFTDRILKAAPRERQALGHIWWYSVEFGLIQEGSETKALGAGLISSFGELNRVFNHQTKIAPFNPDTVAQTEESHHQFHEQLFILHSLTQLETIIKNWTLQV